MGIVIIFVGMILYSAGVLTGIYVGMSMQKEFSKREKATKSAESKSKPKSKV